MSNEQRPTLPETAINKAAIELIAEWNAQEKVANWKIHRLRRKVGKLVAALAGAAFVERPEDATSLRV